MENKGFHQTKIYLGIDWGEKFFGLAMADVELRIAWSVGQFEVEALMEKIIQLKAQNDIEKVIIGGIFQGKIDSNRSKIQAFEKRIIELGVEIQKVDEAFSSTLARRNLLEAGKKNVSKKDNSESARIILQDWLDRDVDF